MGGPKGGIEGSEVEQDVLLLSHHLISCSEYIVLMSEQARVRARVIVDTSVIKSQRIHHVPVVVS